MAALPLDDTLTLRDISRLLRCSTDTVRRHHAEWSKTTGFPRPLPSLAGVRSLRWCRPAVIAWQLQAASGPAGAGAANSTPTATDWEAVADARSAMLVAGIDPDTGAADSTGVDLASHSVPSLTVH